MTIGEITRILEAEVLTGEKHLDRQIGAVCVGDLMSDVLSFNCVNAILLTGLSHIHVVRTAEVTGIAAVCLVYGKRPSVESLQLAADSGIAFLATNLHLFVASGRLYGENLAPCPRK